MFSILFTEENYLSFARQKHRRSKASLGEREKERN